MLISIASIIAVVGVIVAIFGMSGLIYYILKEAKKT